MKRKPLYFFSFSAIIFMLLTAYALFEISKLRNFQFFGELISRVTTNEKVVALTFDDAPTEYTKDVLKTLKNKQVKATFYIIGENLQKDPQTGKETVNQKHELGNHSYSHQRFLLTSQSFIDEEIQKTNALIRETGYQGEITFRPPNGKKLFGLPWYLQQHNIKTIMWDIEPDTYLPKEGDQTQFIVDYTLQHTKPGSIILLHPFCKTCVADREALAEIIDGLQKEGYRFVTVSELLKYQQ